MHTEHSGDHISPDDLERLLLGTVMDEDDLAPLEEHLLVCGECIDKAERMRRDMGIMRAALRGQ
jgi:hypothetical protein